MLNYVINLDTIEDVKRFVACANKCEFDIDLMVGRYAIDAKSIMGVFSLDLGKQLEMVVHAVPEEAANFIEEVSPFIAGEKNG